MTNFYLWNIEHWKTLYLRMYNRENYVLWRKIRYSLYTYKARAIDGIVVAAPRKRMRRRQPITRMYKSHVTYCGSVIRCYSPIPALSHLKEHNFIIMLPLLKFLLIISYYAQSANGVNADFKLQYVFIV